MKPESPHDPLHPVVGEPLHEVVLEATGRSARSRDRPAGRLGRGAGCRSVGPRGARCRRCEAHPRPAPSPCPRHRRAPPRPGPPRTPRARPRGRSCRCLWSSSAASTSGLPPSRMSVPRPAMFVAIVTAPERPACATISASRSWSLALRTLCLIAAPLQHLAEHLADLDADRAHEDRTPGLVLLGDLVDDRVPLALLARVHQVGVVGADHVAVGRNDYDLEVVDLGELLGLGLGGTGHAGELVVHAEVVLERDRGQRPLLVADRDALLGLDRLVQALRPAATGHEAAGELVDDDHLAVLDRRSRGRAGRAPRP